MTTPAEKREQKIAVAEKARELIQNLGNTKDIEARATMLHDRVSEGIKGICIQDKSFDPKQIETLSAIAVHLSLLFDKDLQSPETFLAKCKHEFFQLSSLGKVSIVGVIIACALGIVQLFDYAIQAGQYVHDWYTQPLEASESNTTSSSASTPSTDD